MARTPETLTPRRGGCGGGGPGGGAGEGGGGGGGGTRVLNEKETGVLTLYSLCRAIEHRVQ